MRRVALFIVLPVALVLVATAGAAGRKAAFKAALVTDGHSPKANTTWHYSVRVTDLTGHPIWAQITSRIVDPLGQSHLVEFDGTGHNPYVKNYRFFGNFCDSAIWPTNSAVGIALEFQTVIVTRQGRKVLTYRVTPHS
jgi:hypothetical protein